MSFFVSDDIKEKVDMADLLSDGNKKRTNKRKIMSLICIDKEDTIYKYNLVKINFKNKSKKIKINIQANLSHYDMIYFDKIKPKEILFCQNKIFLSESINIVSATYLKEIELYSIELLCHRL